MTTKLEKQKITFTGKDGKEHNATKFYASLYSDNGELIKRVEICQKWQKNKNDFAFLSAMCIEVK